MTLYAGLAVRERTMPIGVVDSGSANVRRDIVAKRPAQTRAAWVSFV